MYIHLHIIPFLNYLMPIIMIQIVSTQMLVVSNDLLLYWAHLSPPSHSVRPEIHVNPQEAVLSLLFNTANVTRPSVENSSFYSPNIYWALNIYKRGYYSHVAYVRGKSWEKTNNRFSVNKHINRIISNQKPNFQESTVSCRENE